MACTVDFRCLDEGFGGKTAKRKRESQEASLNDSTSMDIDSSTIHPSKRSAVASTSDPNKPMSVPLGKPTYDGVIAGKVSGRTWKQPRTHRSSGRFVRSKGPDLEEMKRQKEIKRAYRERMNELKEEIRSNKVEKRKRKEERELKKKENVFRTGTKLQVISNKKTIEKLQKSKKRKQLIRVDGDVKGGYKKTSNKK